MAADANYSLVPIHRILGRIIDVPLPKRKRIEPLPLHHSWIVEEILDRFSVTDFREWEEGRGLMMNVCSDLIVGIL